MFKFLTAILLIKLLLLIGLSATAQFNYTVANATEPQGADLGSTISAPDVGSHWTTGVPLTICPGASNNIFTLPAAALNAGSLAANDFIWVVYGGNIVGFNGGAVSVTPTELPALSDIHYSFYLGSGVDALNNSTVEIEWDVVDVSNAWVAVQQVNEWGCTDGKWAVFYVTIGDDNAPEINEQTNTNPLSGDDTQNLYIVTQADQGTEFAIDLTDFSTDYDYTDQATTVNGDAVISFDQPSAGNVNPVASDDCSFTFANDLPARVSDTDASSLSDYNYGTTTITWTAEDLSNPATTVAQYVHIFDASDFDITRDGNWTATELGCNPYETALAGDPLTTEDDVFPLGTVTHTQPAGWSLRSESTLLTGPDRTYNNADPSKSYYYTRTYTAVWENVANTNVTFTRVETRTYTFDHDTEAPTYTTQNIIINLDDFGTGSFTADDFTVDNYDNYTLAPTLSIDDFGGLADGNVDCGDIGVYTLTITSTDECDNVTTQNPTVTIRDIEDPTASTKSINPGGLYDTNVNDGGGCRFIVEGTEFDLTPIADNCSVNKLLFWVDGATIIGSSGSPIEIVDGSAEDMDATVDGVVTYTLGPTGYGLELTTAALSTIHWIVEDPSGNQSTEYTYAITVVDDSYPYIAECESPEHVAYDYSQASLGLTYNKLIPTPVDACNDIQSFDYRIQPTGAFPLTTAVPGDYIAINLQGMLVGATKYVYWIV